MHSRRNSITLIVSLGFLSLGSTQAASPTNFIQFNRDVRPILAENCLVCHGPDHTHHKTKLRLDLREIALERKAIVPGQPEKSELVHRIFTKDEDDAMPPPEADKKLTAAQKNLLKRWIAEGAEYQEHWAFIAPVRAPMPEVRNKNRVKNPVDTFVLAELEKQKIKPSPEADQITLIRRLNLDLLGLPPSPEEIKTFLRDKDPRAYERLVDRLLASPHFGERWGRHWLDLARYADSDGYEKDEPRPYAYLYRDWVIGAINRDLPFDQFTIEQLAGDLLPGANQEQKLATGFHRQTLINKEGGVDQEEFRNKAVVDRVDTTGAVWMGLTVGCAECHSHKYDPLSHREFYQLFAFFNHADDEELPAPTSVELEKYLASKNEWDAQHAKLKKIYDEYLRDSLPAKQTRWETDGKLDLAVWNVLEPAASASAAGATLTKQADQSISVSGVNPLSDTYTIEAVAPSSEITGFRLEVLPDDEGKKGPGRTGHGNFFLSEFNAKIQSTNSVEFRTIGLRNAMADFSQKDWDIAGAIDGKTNTGWGIAPEAKRRHAAIFECAEPLKLEPGEKLIFTLDQQYGNQHTIARFRLSATAGPPPLKATLVDDLVAVAWSISPDQRTEEQKAMLAEYFRDQVDPEARKFRKPLLDHAKNEPKYPATKAAILVERKKGRETHVHIRGDFLRPGELVEPGTPAVLPAFRPRGTKPDRLDLARWLMDEANPLTSRVTVNHIWKNLFGRGLVASVNDFGTRGEKPSHPELLDWLATEFPRLGWSRKALIKLIVTSATYRQSSSYRPDLAERDPLNVLLARQNRLRLEAEIVRDAHLSASGLLANKIGGPSVRPALPADIAALGYANSIKWKESDGEDRYRRGMYIFFQRTVPYPMLVTFDAPDSNTTCTRRERSNTPLQALTLWNDPVFFECARALGKRVMIEPTVDARLKRAFELCMSRPPGSEEASRLLRLYEDQQRLILENPGNTAAILGLDKKAEVPADAADRASLIAVARIIMNLDEFINRD